MTAARWKRARYAAVGTVGLLFAGIGGPLAVGSARDGARDAGRLEHGSERPVVTRGRAAVPALGPCPDGTRKSGGPGGFSVCAPSLAPRFATCDAAEAPAGALHVAIGGTGDGSLAAPLGSLDEALARAAEGAVIVLGPGDFAAPSRPLVGASLQGSCADRTRIAGPLRLEGRASVERLALDGALEVRAAAEAFVHDVVVHGGGVAVSQRAHLRLARVSVRGTAPSGLAVSGGATLDAEVISIAGAELALRVSGPGTSARIALLHTSDADAPMRAALRVEDGAEVSLARSQIAGGAEARIVIAGATLRASDLVVTGDDGAGLVASAGARVSMARVAFVGAGARALDVSASRLELEDFSLADHRGSSSGTSDAAVRASDGAQVRLRSGSIVRPRARGVLTTGEGTSVSIHEVAIVSTHASRCATASLGCAAPPAGDGIAVLDGAVARVSASSIEGSRGCGILVGGRSSRAELESSRITTSRIALCGDAASRGWLRLGADVVEDQNESVIARPMR